MKFIDEAEITVQSGNGGKGCVSFRREKFIPRGGPDGGDGGKGGDVRLFCSPRKRTLLHFQFQRQFKAKNGAHGQGSQKTGKNGENLIVEIPPGTLVRDADSGQIIKDFSQPDEFFVIAQGGRGGKGNMHFATSTNRAPRFAQPGEPGLTFRLKLELKLLADVGIIGFPNAGKSTLISVISSARPKIADYPFTTLTPTLGVVKPAFGGEPFVVADIPGLIEGAHQGTGLGTRFLRHIERTRILVHLIDASAVDPDDPLNAFNTVNNELSLHNKTLAEKPQIIALNKLDLTEAQEKAPLFQAAVGNQEVHLISAATGKGVDNLIAEIVRMLQQQPV